VGLFEQCPLAYRYRYLDEVPDAFATIEQHLGQAVHDTLEQAYAERGRGAAVDGAWMASAFARDWATPDPASFRIVKRGITAAEYRDRGFAMVAAFHARVFADDTSETLGLEQRFQIALDATRDWAGIIDRLARLGDGTLRIVDYKTGASLPNPAVDRQLRSYALQVLAEHGAERVELCVEGLRTGNTLVAEFGAGEAAGVRDGLLAAIGEIEAASAWPARPTILCDWCGFNPICPEAGGRSRPARKRTAW
jgi:putative RecB family exonuclease